MRRSARDVITEIARKHDLGYEELLRPDRHRDRSWPRHEAMFEAYVQCPHLSYPMLGKAFRMDHSSVVHGVQAHCKRIGINYDSIKTRTIPRVIRLKADWDRFPPRNATEYRYAARI